MRIEENAPCCLTLAIARQELTNGFRTAMLGITRQHPPVDLTDQLAPMLDVTGASAVSPCSQVLSDAPHAETRRVLDVLAHNCAVVTGKSLTGLARWDVIGGARHAVLDRGTVTASICMSTGATIAPADQARAR